MISFFEASLKTLSIHHIGNPVNDEFYSLSMAPLPVRSPESSYLLHYFLSPFGKVNEMYNLHHATGDLNLNPVYESVYGLLTRGTVQGMFHEVSKELAKHLFDSSKHPKIKSGEMYVAFFEGIQFEGELFDAVGIFKSEIKETYLKVEPNQLGFDLSFEDKATSIHKLDKGCLILNKSANEGFTVLCIDQTNGKDATYWKDEFLSLKIASNTYHQTDAVINICKTFIQEQLDQDFEISKADKIDLLNKSLKYFKEKESFDTNEYAEEILSNPEAVSSFKKYKSVYDEEFDLNLPESFDINTAAVKKKKSSFRPIMKLDKNFTVYVHGSKDLIEKGYDENKDLNFYKVYFKEEQ